MLLALSLVWTNLVGLIIQLALPHTLSASEYARYSINIGVSLWLVIAAFEWMRLATLRDPCANGKIDGKSSIAPVNSSIFFVVAAISAAIGFLYAVSYYMHIAINSLHIISATSVCIGSQGVFEVLLARLRSAGQDRAYVAFSLVRGGLTLLLSLFCAKIFGSAESALYGYAGSFLVATCVLLVFNLKVRQTTGSPQAENATIWGAEGIASIGFPLAIGSVLSLLIPTASRFALGTTHSTSVIAGTLLSFDLCLKLAAVSGTLGSLLYSQKTIRAIQAADVSMANKALFRQILFTLSFSLMSVIALLVAKGPLVDYLFPAGFREAARADFLLAAVCATAITLRSSVFDASFIVTGNRSAAVSLPLLSLLSTILLYFTFTHVLGTTILATFLSIILGAIAGALGSIRVLSRVWLTRKQWIIIACASLAFSSFAVPASMLSDYIYSQSLSFFVLYFLLIAALALFSIGLLNRAVESK